MRVGLAVPWRRCGCHSGGARHETLLLRWAPCRGGAATAVLHTRQAGVCCRVSDGLCRGGAPAACDIIRVVTLLQRHVFLCVGLAVPCRHCYRGRNSGGCCAVDRLCVMVSRGHGLLRVGLAVPWRRCGCHSGGARHETLLLRWALCRGGAATGTDTRALCRGGAPAACDIMHVVTLSQRHGSLRVGRAVPGGAMVSRGNGGVVTGAGRPAASRPRACAPGRARTARTRRERRPAAAGRRRPVLKKEPEWRWLLALESVDYVQDKELLPSPLYEGRRKRAGQAAYCVRRPRRSWRASSPRRARRGRDRSSGRKWRGWRQRGAVSVCGSESGGDGGDDGGDGGPSPPHVQGCGPMDAVVIGAGIPDDV